MTNFNLEGPYPTSDRGTIISLRSEIKAMQDHIDKVEAWFDYAEEIILNTNWIIRWAFSFGKALGERPKWKKEKS